MVHVLSIITIIVLTPFTIKIAQIFYEERIKTRIRKIQTNGNKTHFKVKATRLISRVSGTEVLRLIC